MTANQRSRNLSAIRHNVIFAMLWALAALILVVLMVINGPTTISMVAFFGSSILYRVHLFHADWLGSRL